MFNETLLKSCLKITIELYFKTWIRAYEFSNETKKITVQNDVRSLVE